MIQSDQTDPWLTRSELAVRLKLSQKTLAQWGSDKGPRFAKIGGAVRYKLSDVVDWENQQFNGAA